MELARKMESKVTIIIPDGVDFRNLGLAYEQGDIAFSWDPIERICEASGIDIAVFRDQPEDNVARLITHWYAAHLEHGGARDPVADSLLAEVLAEELAGQHFSLPGGRA